MFVARVPRLIAVALDLDDIALEAHPRTSRKADLDLDVGELSYDRRLSMAARRAADLFDYCSMYATASLLRERADAAEFEVNAAADFLDPQ